MQFNIIPLDSGRLPAYLQNAPSELADLTTGVSSGFGYLSIEGKAWTVVNGAEKTMIMHPQAPDVPAQALPILIVKASPNLSRTFYLSKYEKGVDSKPDCMSDDGIRPDPASPKPQSQTCAACPHSVYGTGENGKGFRCANHRRLAVVLLNDLERALLLRIPGGSLNNLRDYASELGKRGLKSYRMVVTEAKFDKESPTPKIQFGHMGLVPDEIYNHLTELAESDQVAQILGAGAQVVADVPAAPAAPAITQAPKAEVPAAAVAAVIDESKPVATAPAPTAQAPIEVPQAAVQTVVTNVVDLVPPAPAAEPAKPAVTMTSGEYNSFDDMLDAYDD